MQKLSEKQLIIQTLLNIKDWWSYQVAMRMLNKV